MLMAVKKASRPITCIPCAMKYSYIQERTPELLVLMGRLEKALYCRPRLDLSLEQRIYHLAEGVLALQEVEILGRTSTGRLPDRIKSLIEFILERNEARVGLLTPHTIPERVKSTRRHVIKQLEGLSNDDANRQTTDGARSCI